MRSATIALLLLLSLLTTTGCNVTDTFQTVKVTPEFIQKQLKPFLPNGAKWIKPKYGPLRDSFYAKDLNGDDKPEGIGLYQLDDKLGIIIIAEETDKKWTKKGELTFNGNHLDFLGFGDMTTDNKLEIMLSYEVDTLQSKSVLLSWDNQTQLKTVFEKPTTASAFDDFDGDNKMDLVLFTQSPNQFQSEAQLYQPSKTIPKQTQTYPLTGSVTMSSVEQGNVQKNRKGIVLDLNIGAHSGEAAILYIKQGKLYNAFSNELKSNKNFRLYNTKSKDVNKDGVIDIAFTKTPKSYDGQQVANALQSTTYAWYTWQANNKLQLLNKYYEDSYSGFRFEFPSQWHDIPVETKMGAKGRDLYFILPQNGTQLQLASVHAVRKDEWKEFKQVMDVSSNGGYFKWFILEERNDVVYVGEIHNAKIYESMPPEALADFHKAQKQGLLLDEKQIRKQFEVYKKAD